MSNSTNSTSSDRQMLSSLQRQTLQEVKDLVENALESQLKLSRRLEVLEHKIELLTGHVSSAAERGVVPKSTASLRVVKQVVKQDMKRKNWNRMPFFEPVQKRRKSHEVYADESDLSSLSECSQDMVSSPKPQSDADGQDDLDEEESHRSNDSRKSQDVTDYERSKRSTAKGSVSALSGRSK
eukprot:GILK01008518.1.p1 GENE.GILK01008518.1~~GILK01008518.1.p1  ORF type:complete len:182 (+),score=21.30 GILK01008518.1:141-686(+)